MTALVQYFKESYEELKKVQWPTKKEVWNYTLVVIVLSGLVALFLGGLDFIFLKLAETFLFE